MRPLFSAKVVYSRKLCVAAFGLTSDKNSSIICLTLAPNGCVEACDRTGCIKFQFEFKCFIQYLRVLLIKFRRQKHVILQAIAMEEHWHINSICLES